MYVYIYKNSAFKYIVHIYVYIYNMCDEKNVCILHRCSKAIVNIYIYIYTLKKYFVCIYILQTYSSDFSGDVYNIYTLYI